MSLNEVFSSCALSMQALDDILEANDPALELLWLRVRGSYRWVASAGADPFCELMQHEVIRTLGIRGWTSDRRVKRIHAFARLAGFLR